MQILEILLISQLHVISFYQVSSPLKINPLCVKFANLHNCHQIQRQEVVLIVLWVNNRKINTLIPGDGSVGGLAQWTIIVLRPKCFESKGLHFLGYHCFSISKVTHKELKKHGSFCQIDLLIYDFLSWCILLLIHGL